jgi:hypothetical protein
MATYQQVSRALEGYGCARRSDRISGADRASSCNCFAAMKVKWPGFCQLSQHKASSACELDSDRLLTLFFVGPAHDSDVSRLTLVVSEIYARSDGGIVAEIRAPMHSGRRRSRIGDVNLEVSPGPCIIQSLRIRRGCFQHSATRIAHGKEGSRFDQVLRGRIVA